MLDVQNHNKVFKDKVEINALISYAPAKVYITYAKSHNGYYGCGKCIQESRFGTK